MRNAHLGELGESAKFMALQQGQIEPGRELPGMPPPAEMPGMPLPFERKKLPKPADVIPLTRDWVRKAVPEDIGKEHLKFVDILSERTKTLRLELLEDDQGYLKYSAKLLDNGNIEVAFKVMLPPHSPEKFSMHLEPEDIASTEALYKLFLKKIAKDYLWERDEEADRKRGYGLTNTDRIRIREMAQDIQKALEAYLF